jgi:hypothetical protein
VLLLPPQDKHAPLHLAAHAGKKDVAELLLRHKADVNSVNKVSADGGEGGGWGGGGLLYSVFWVLGVYMNIYI